MFHFSFAFLGSQALLGCRLGASMCYGLGPWHSQLVFFLEDLPSKAKNCYREILVDIEDFEKKVPEKSSNFELLNFYILFAIWKIWRKKFRIKCLPKLNFEKYMHFQKWRKKCNRNTCIFPSQNNCVLTA